MQTAESIQLKRKKVEKQDVFYCWVIKGKWIKMLLVPMRLGDTPVPIPNTTVKTQSADGTALETVWESRWLPDQKERNRRSCLIKIERALESELCRKQSGTRRFSISPVLTLNQSGRTVIIAGFYQWSEFTKTVCEFWWLIKHQSALYLENCIHEIWLS